MTVVGEAQDGKYLLTEMTLVKAQGVGFVLAL
jgi:hypothetical protein